MLVRRTWFHLLLANLATLELVGGQHVGPAGMLPTAGLRLRFARDRFNSMVDCGGHLS